MNRKRLATVVPVEIDGERYHRDWNREHVCRGQLRDMRLMEMGWDVRRLQAALTHFQTFRL